jgi:hypothetical protein
MVERVDTSGRQTEQQSAPSFADVVSNSQVVAQAIPGSHASSPNIWDVGLCRAGKVAQGGAGVVETAGGTVIAMGGVATTILGGAVALFETPVMNIAGGQPFWGTAMAGAGISGIGVGTSLSADGIDRIGAQFTSPACNAPR